MIENEITKNKNLQHYFLVMVLVVLIVVFILFEIIQNKKTVQTVARFNDLAQKYEFVLGGEVVGIKLLATGVLVVGIDYEESDLRVGDIILEVDGNVVSSNAELVHIINSNENTDVQLLVEREKKKKSIVVQKRFNEKNKVYELGLWVKDSSAGVGTVTFYEKRNSYFVALGHGVTETSANIVLPINSGAIVKAVINDIQKGVPKSAGDIRGTIYKEVKGQIVTNTKNGIYGEYVKEVPNNKVVEVASKYDIAEGDAKIYCTLDDNVVSEYNVKITKVLLDSTGNKNMIIQVNDEQLLEKTGGIVQGMSGSPIVQNDRLVGAVTHVFLNDPTKGYAVFVQNMIEDMEEMAKNI